MGSGGHQLPRLGNGGRSRVTTTRNLAKICREGARGDRGCGSPIPPTTAPIEGSGGLSVHMRPRLGRRWSASGHHSLNPSLFLSTDFVMNSGRWWPEGGVNASKAWDIRYITALEIPL
ncbi:hypothetical protein CRG98_023553 [Punica granatum]|uniref:Uncharacterized protein n=1 Tax=Punica granatum TaxID=22663 RepID=A0A2I0JIF5_PUNGR|nr:hypothetical protein CRG98_023553 [Punica granatum]